MKRDRPSIVTAWIVGIFLGVCGLLGQVWGADYVITISVDGTADSVYPVWKIGVPPVLADSTAGWADLSGAVKCTISYTAGDYVEPGFWYRWAATDSWLWCDLPTYNSASAATLDSPAVFGAMVQLAQDSSHLFIGGAGGGSNQVTFVTLSSEDSSAIGRVTITLRSVDGGAVQYEPIITSTLGLKTVELSADSFVVQTGAVPYLTTYDTIVVSGTQSDTILLTAFDPGAPADSAYCRCWFYISSLRNHPDFGTYLRTKGVEVCYSPLYRVENSCNNTWSTEGPFCEDTDSLGYVYVDLVWSSCQLKDGEEVQYKLEVDGKEAIPAFTVPDSASYKVF